MAARSKSEPWLGLCEFETQFDQHLECRVCLDRYTNPKTLPCNHSFCLRCITNLEAKIQNSQHCISCPICRLEHVIPLNRASEGDFPNAFLIVSLLELREKLATAKSVTCSKHNDSLRMYCETCEEVICRDCAASKEHNRHDCVPVSECYSAYHEKLLQHLEQKVKHKAVDMNTAIQQLTISETEVLQQGELLKEGIKAHAQQMMECILMSQSRLLKQVDTIVQTKASLLREQKSQAEMLHTRLLTCEEVTEHIMTKCNQTQILSEKSSILKNIDVASHAINSEVFKPLERADLVFRKRVGENEIGFVTSSGGYGQATIRVSPSLSPGASLSPSPSPSPKVPQQCQSTATLVLKSHDGTPFPVPLSLISSSLTSPNGHSFECEITEAHTKGEYMITFDRFTKQDQLVVQVGGINVFRNPVIVDVTEMRGTPIVIVTELCTPWGVAASANGDIIVAENNAHCVTILTKSGKKVRSFGKEGTKDGEFTSPRGVAITDDGHILVTDLHRLQKLTLDGVCVKSVGGGRTGRQLRYPTGIAFHCPTKQVFVADSDNNRIRVFSNELTLICTIAQYGSNEQFNSPYDVALDSEGYLYVAEWEGHCITKLTTAGRYVRKFGCKGSAKGQLLYPTAVTVMKGMVFVSEWGNDRISIFDTDGNFLHCFGSKGSESGEFNKPYAITTDTQEKVLYISDFMNNRVVVC